MQIISVIIGRASHAFVLLLVVVVLNFTLIHLAPGDAADVIAGEMGGASPEIMAGLRATYGLDQGFLAQLWLYVSHVLTGDLGQSYYFNAPVSMLILQRLPATLLLVLTANVLAIGLGVLLGALAARRPHSPVNHLITVLSLIGFSAPVFWTGLLLIIVFASALPIFPIGGMRDVTNLDAGWFAATIDTLYHLVLPVVTLALIYLAQYSRLTRSTMLEVLGADYIRTARAKGVSERLVVFKHALRNAVLPVVTTAGLQFSGVLAGAVLVETVFSWRGLGSLAYESILRRDTPTLLGILLCSALVVIAVNLLTDLTYSLVDPRIRRRA
jgi:peptide/nickel transport system permease protein